MDSLVKIDGKPIEKLIEVVSNAIGTLYEPRQLVRIARAEAEAERIKPLKVLKGKRYWPIMMNGMLSYLL